MWYAPASSCSSCASCFFAAWLSDAELSSARSAAFCRCRLAIVLCAEGPPVIESNRLATGPVTSCVTCSTGPKMSAPAFLAGDAPPSLKSSVIRTTAMSKSTPRTRRVRRLSCTSAPRPPAAAAERAWRGAPGNRRRLSAPGVGHQDLTQGLEVLDALAGAEDHGVERVVRHLHGHPGLLPDS